MKSTGVLIEPDEMKALYFSVVTLLKNLAFTICQLFLQITCTNHMRCNVEGAACSDEHTENYYHSAFLFSSTKLFSVYVAVHNKKKSDS